VLLQLVHHAVARQALGELEGVTKRTHAPKQHHELSEARDNGADELTLCGLGSLTRSGSSRTAASSFKLASSSVKLLGKSMLVSESPEKGARP